MLRLDHFVHLPELDPLIERLIAEGPGLVVVAGLDSRPRSDPGGQAESGAAFSPGRFVPSGRTTIFRILVREALAHHPGPAVVVARDEDAIRVPRPLRRRVQLVRVQPGTTYAEAVARAVRRAPVLLIIDHLDAGVVPAALDAARQGLRILAQIDTVLAGSDVARQLLDLGASREQLVNLTWIVSVQRVSTLCRHCRQMMTPDPQALEALSRRYPAFHDTPGTEVAYQALGCEHCQHTGRLGHVACFDVYRADSDVPDLFEQASVLSAEQYVVGLAQAGLLSLQDVLRFEREQLRRTYSLFAASERALAETNAALKRKLIELEATNRVLQQRTDALISLQDFGQALVGDGLTGVGTALDQVALRICRHARDLCGADRAVLYLIRRSACLSRGAERHAIPSARAYVGRNGTRDPCDEGERWLHDRNRSLCAR